MPGKRILHVKEASSYNYCHRYCELMVKQSSGDLTEEETHSIEWEAFHHPLNVFQYAAYQKDQEDVWNGCNNQHIIITHDFSKIKTQYHQHQDYIQWQKRGDQMDNSHNLTINTLLPEPQRNKMLISWNISEENCSVVRCFFIIGVTSSQQSLSLNRTIE